jgi:hypothetical protein
LTLFDQATVDVFLRIFDAGNMVQRNQEIGA